MPSELEEASLRDILHHIDLVQQFTAGQNYETFNSDTLRVYGVVRCLEIISEASRRLPDDLKARHPTITWKGGRRKCLSPRLPGCCEPAGLGHGTFSVAAAASRRSRRVEPFPRGQVVSTADVTRPLSTAARLRPSAAPRRGSACAP